MSDRIIVNQKVDNEQYKNILSHSTIVISTSLHEFQGLSVLEAASAGARPLVPDALCYPEQYDVAYRYPAGNKQAIVDRIRQWLTVELPPAVDVSKWYESALTGQWAQLLDCELGGQQHYLKSTAASKT